ncbi:DUF3617 domain-containing protein [Brevundimonas sp.]|uniref:DUF3617 domain-containing protein n=1 Tax=Brevundimonas sp. TaxID=1871086 RepID=UPI002D6BF0CE|nr:DUF3617 family protein [Brevundimonas sp.]HYC73401.1 DUF3617 family protein [Brevundimonas sp.]
MRTIMIVSGLAALSLASCGPGENGSAAEKAGSATGKAAGADMPKGPTPGLWRVTTRMSGLPAGMEPPPIETCIREAKFEPPAGAAPHSPGMTCDSQSFRREGDAMVSHMVCTSADGVRTVTDTRVTGDYTRNYTMEVKSTMTPAPTPSMAEVSMVMNAERLGDCPAEPPAG